MLKRLLPRSLPPKNPSQKLKDLEVTNMKETKDNTSYSNYKKDGPELKIVQQAQAELIMHPQKPNKDVPQKIARPAVTVRPPKPGKPYNT